LLEELAFVVANEQANLQPALNGNFGNCCNSVWHICKLDALFRRQVTRPSEVLWNDVTNAGQHANPAVLELHTTTAPEVVHVTVCRQTQRVPEANWGLDTQLALEGTRREPHFRTSCSHGTVLENHGTQSNHCKSSVGNFGRQFLLPHLRIGEGDRVKVEDEVLTNTKEAVVLEVTRSAVPLLLEELAFVVANEQANLQPALNGNFGNCCNSVWHICKLDALFRRQVTRPSEVLWNDVTNAGQHANPAVLELHTTTAPEVVHVTVCRQTQRVPEANWCLHAKLSFESRCARDPHCGTSGAKIKILCHHSSDCDHCEAAVVELRIQLFRAAFRVTLAGEEWHTELAEARGVARNSILVLAHGEEFQEGDEDANLSPAFGRHFAQCSHAVGDVCELKAKTWRARAWPSEELWSDVAHACPHGHAAIFDLSNASTTEDLLVPILGHAERVKVLHRFGDSSLGLECTFWDGLAASAGRNAAMATCQNCRCSSPSRKVWQRPC